MATLVKLELNNEKVKYYNELVEKCRKEFPECANHFMEVNNLNDMFIPYMEITFDDLITIEDDYRNNFDGVYFSVSGTNDELEMLTNYKEKRTLYTPLYWRNYGVCDNASQVLDYYDFLYNEHKSYMEDKKFVILLTPVFKENQPEHGGWRWHKWGQYIGKFKSMCEYLYDEQGIDYVICFNIVEVEKC